MVLAAINVSPDSTEVYEAMRSMRRAGKIFFAQRLRQGVEDGQLPRNTDIDYLASTLKAMLEGMSIQARDGLAQAAQDNFLDAGVEPERNAVRVTR